MAAINLIFLKRFQSIWEHPANKNNQFQAIGRSIGWWLNNRNSSTPVEVELCGYRLLLYSDAFQTRSIVYYTPFHDYDSMRFVQRYLRSGDNFIDIGANIGEYTLLACSIIGDSGSVSAFEPVPKTVNRLKENIDINQLSQVKVYPIALGDTDSIVSFTLTHDAVSHITVLNDLPQANKIQVPCHRLENVLEDKLYAMAKIDVEGGELSAIKGANKLLSQKNPPVLMLEINGAFKRYGVTKKEILNYLSTFGYRSAIYKADTNHLTFTEDVWGDVLFIANDYLDQVVDRISTSDQL